MAEVSIVIPAYNEAGAIEETIQKVDASFRNSGHTYEIIVVDDCSTDNSVAVLTARAQTMPHLRIVRHDRSGGQSAAVHSGVKAAHAPIICTLDGDGQNPPEELPKLAAPLLNDTTGKIGLVAGQRVGRQDSWSKRFASRFANRLRGWILQDGTRDTGCGL
ncbi:MAG: glycosyltransferase family 2 protein, partial [Verrucomicrobia subdivision 3 bacterium]|nr:glycosyltransferase family 2 protein [Limisphaerales bacterium]